MWIGASINKHVCILTASSMSCLLIARVWLVSTNDHDILYQVNRQCTNYVMQTDTLTNTFKPATTKWFHFLYLVNPEMCFIIGDVNMHHRELNMYKFGCKAFDVEWFDTSTFITFIQLHYFASYFYCFMD